MAKKRVSISPLIRLSLEDLIRRADARVIEISDEDKQLAMSMLERLAEFAVEYNLDPRDRRTDELARDNAWLDAKWKWIQDECFERIRQIALGDRITDADVAMIREVFCTISVHVMASMRAQLVDRTLR